MRARGELSIVLIGLASACTDVPVEALRDSSLDLDARSVDADSGDGGERTPHDARASRPVPFDGTVARLPCNGSPSLCELPLDEIAFAGTHASQAHVTPPWARPAQHQRVRRQLDDGVRALFLETHVASNGPIVCYGDCDAGSTPLSVPLSDVRGFLDDNPRDVVILVVENHAGAAFSGAIEDAGLSGYVHRQVKGDAWPALVDLIDAGHRLVALVDAAPAPDAGTALAFTPLFDVAFATAGGAESVSDLRCEVSRGERAEHALFIVHHYLRAPEDGGVADGAAPRLAPSESLAESINGDPFFTNRLRACEAEQSHVPNVVDVDFYDLGDAVDAVVRYNRER